MIQILLFMRYRDWFRLNVPGKGLPKILLSSQEHFFIFYASLLKFFNIFISANSTSNYLLISSTQIISPNHLKVLLQGTLNSAYIVMH